jgi:hypothetical protein
VLYIANRKPVKTDRFFTGQTPSSEGLPVAISASGTSIPAGFVHSFIHSKLTAIKFPTVGPRYCGGGFFVRTHFYESESFGVAGVTINNDLG